MSAIFGIIGKMGLPIETAAVNKIQQALAHRATDGSGLWQNENAALGFCKLAVYPQQEKEQLPLEAGDIILTADARIDNRDQLYRLLHLDQQQWQQEPDAHLLLKAWQQWEKECVNYLEGEYVFAVWNKVSQTLFIATDAFGFRPVFYYDGPEQFIFCSEIKGILAAKTTPNYFNEENLIEYFFRQSDPAQTYNKEVFALCGGNALTLQEHPYTIEKYWRPQPSGKYHFTKDEDWIACLRELLFRAVEKRLNPEVPVGVTLSGGLDSTTVACILSQLLAKKNKPLYAFSSVLPVDHTGIEQDERKYIEMVNRYCPNIIQTYVEAPGAGPFTDVEAAFEKDEMIPNAFFYMDFAISAAAQEKNIRSLFSGFGGDMLVSCKGNSVIHQLVGQKRFSEAWGALKKISGTQNKTIGYLLKTEYLAQTKAYALLRKLVKGNPVNPQMVTTLKDGFVRRYRDQLKNNPFINPVTFMNRYLTTGRMSRTTGRFANHNESYQMAACTPLFDKEVVEFLLKMPSHLYIMNGWKRGVIRHTMEGIIPKEIQWRNDKSAYSPDYPNRIIESRQKLDQVMQSPQFAFIFDQYIDKEMILRRFNDIQPFTGFGNDTSLTATRIAQAGILSIVLNHLKKEGYLFQE